MCTWHYIKTSVIAFSVDFNTLIRQYLGVCVCMIDFHVGGSYSKKQWCNATDLLILLLIAKNKNIKEKLVSTGVCLFEWNACETWNRTRKREIVSFYFLHCLKWIEMRKYNRVKNFIQFYVTENCFISNRRFFTHLHWHIKLFAIKIYM